MELMRQSEGNRAPMKVANGSVDKKATLALSDLISQKTVNCQVSGRDRYKRSIAICFVGRLDLNAWMVEQGWAVAYRKYSTDYVTQEDEAKQEKRGIWKGEFVMPWEWRAKKKKR